MPFTLSHPAAIAALPRGLRSSMPLAALAIGAMSPDFEYLLRLRPITQWSHTPPGLFWFCLPAGLVVWTTWELAVRTPIRTLLALPSDRVAPRFRDLPWLAAAAAVLIGAWSHLLWDGFTHAYGWGVDIVPALREVAFSIRGRPFAWYNAVQHGSTLVGGIVVLAWLWNQLERADSLSHIRRSPARLVSMAGMLVVAALAGLINGAFWYRLPADYWTAERVLGSIAVGWLVGLALAILGYSLAVRIGVLRAEPAS